MEEGLPDDESEIAKEGTLLHRLDGDPSLSRKHLKRKQLDLLEISERLTKEAFTRIGDQFGVSDRVPDESGLEKEMYLHRGVKSLFSGHCDVLEYFAEPKLLIILEKKFGFLSVDPASSNMQTRTYACMGAQLCDCDNVAVAISSPRLPAADRLTLAVYNREEIAAAEKQLFAIWDACNAPDAPLNATESGCRYCKAKLTCPEFAEAFQTPLSLVPHPNGADSLAKRQVETEQRLAQLNDVDLGRILDAIQFADFVKDMAREVARERIAAGAMPGWKLGPAKEKRDVTDPFQAAQILKGAGLPIEKIMSCCSMSLGDDGGVAEIYREHNKCTWKEAKDAINDLLSSVIEKTPMKQSVTRDCRIAEALADAI